jgi:LemA protein
MSNFLWVIIAIAALIILWAIFAFNRLISFRNRVKEAWSDIEVQLKRRYDLIPNLIETVKGYAAHERGVFEKVTEARTKAMGAQSVQEHQEADNFLSATLKTLFAVAENYPDLKANANFLDLQRELADTENKIQAARRFYNSVVQEYKNALEMFPSNVIANTFNFKAEQFFELKTSQEAEPIVVQF